MILSQDQTLVKKFLLALLINVRLFVLCFELTHGLAYLVFKNQIAFLALFFAPRFVRGEIIDYTESIFFVNPEAKLFNFRFRPFRWGEVTDYTELKIFVNRSVKVFNFSLFTVKILTSETSDYTEAILIVNRSNKIFNFSLF